MIGSRSERVTNVRSAKSPGQIGVALVALGNAAVILREQVAHFDTSPADLDAVQRGDQCGGVLSKEGHHRLMQGLLPLGVTEQDSRIDRDPPHQWRSSRRAWS